MNGATILTAQKRNALLVVRPHVVDMAGGSRKVVNALKVPWTPFHNTQAAALGKLAQATNLGRNEHIVGLMSDIDRGVLTLDDFAATVGATAAEARTRLRQAGLAPLVQPGSGTARATQWVPEAWIDAYRGIDELAASPTSAVGTAVDGSAAPVTEGARKPRGRRVLAAAGALTGVGILVPTAPPLITWARDTFATGAAPTPASADPAGAPVTEKGAEKPPASADPARPPATEAAPEQTEESAPEDAAPRGVDAAQAALREMGVKEHYLDFDEERLEQTAAYNERRNGERTWKLDPSAIVLHFTVMPENPYDYFNDNQPVEGEHPNVSAHFVIEQDGTIEQQLPLDVRARHAIGMNHASIGIEMVETTSADRILDRPAQLEAARELVRTLSETLEIDEENITGHAIANDSPLFRDDTGATNQREDWNAAQVEEFKAGL